MTRRPEYDDSHQLEHRPRRRFSAAQAIGAVLMSLLLGGCLGSGSLVGLAQRQQLGPARDLALDIARANDRVANFLSVNRLADESGEALGRATEEIDLDEIVAPTETAGPVATPTPFPLRAVTADAPLELWVGGDSVSRDLGDGMARITPVDLVEPELASQISSGLSRPDFFDWPQELARVMTGDDPPDAVVIMFGANDWQNVEHEGAVLERGSAEWSALYGERVGLAMDILNRPGTTVAWVGQPRMRDAGLDAGMVQLNQIYLAEAASRDWIDYVDMELVFSPYGGGYTDTIDGTVVRQPDGIHVNFAGADRMATAAWDVVRTPWGL